MSKPLSYIVKDTFITVFINGRPVTINSENENYSAVIEAIKTEQWDSIPDLISKKASIERAVSRVGKGKVVIDGGQVFYEGEEIHGELVRRMLDMIKLGYDVSRHILFMENLMENPSRSSVNELWDFMERNDLPISEDGYLLAYKKVKSNFKDLYSGTFDNSPGQFVEMKRNDVDDDRAHECSSGLHFCSYSYLHSYGGTGDVRVVMVKINPRDVVSFPRDYNYAKGRCSGYEVIEEIPDWHENDSLTQENIVSKERVNSSALEQSIEILHSEIQNQQNAGIHKISDLSKNYAWPFPVGVKKYFGKTESELYTMSNSELVEMWNAAQGPYSPMLVKFRDKETGVKRIIRLAEEMKRVS